MTVTATLKPDPNSGAAIEDIDRHYYANQVVSSGPWDTTYAFRMAAAHAKDRARHNQIRAIRAEEAKARGELGAASRLEASEARRARSVDGVVGAPDDAIKL